MFARILCCHLFNNIMYSLLVSFTKEPKHVSITIIIMPSIVKHGIFTCQLLIMKIRIMMITMMTIMIMLIKVIIDNNGHYHHHHAKHHQTWDRHLPVTDHGFPISCIKGSQVGDNSRGKKNIPGDVDKATCTKYRLFLRNHISK